jgi:hypothetical protein
MCNFAHGQEAAVETYRSYSGRVVDGKPVIFGNPDLPENAGVIVTVLRNVGHTELLDDDPSAKIDRKQMRMEAFAEFIRAMAEIEDESLDEEFDMILAKRMNITMELDI